MVTGCFVSYVGVDSLEYLFTYSTNFAFGWVDYAAGWIFGDIVFVVFERYEGLSFCSAFGSVLVVE